MTIITIGAVAWTVYESSANADAYQLSRPGTTWPVGSSAAKDASLVAATRWLNEQRWQGVETTPAPAGPTVLAWPRTGIVDKNGNAIPTNVIPFEIIWGYYELAMALLADPTILSNQYGTASNIKRVKGGTAEVTFFRPLGGTRLPTPVADLISQYMDLGSAEATGLASGTIDPNTGDPYPSSFDGSQDVDDFGIVR